MRKIISLLCMVVLMFAFVGCSGEKEVAETSENFESSAVEMVDEDKDEKSDDSEVEDAVVKVVDVIEEEQEEDVAFLLDTSLTNLELLASIPYKMPGSVVSVTESVAADGTVAISKMYTKGFFTRTENEDVDGSMQVIIYNPDLGATWMFNESQGFGMVSYDEDDEDALDEGVFEGATFADLYAEEDMENFEAKIEELDGEKVIAIHTKEDDGMDGSMDIFMWFSAEYGVVMKYEMYMNDTLLGSAKVVEFEVDGDIDDSLFEAPEGIEFMEY